MKVTLQSTNFIVTGNGAKARLWEGETEKGIKCYALIPVIAARRDADNGEFELDLQECFPASDEARRIFDARMIL
jgi:hypothetical protein